MAAKRKGEKTVLTRQDIQTRRKALTQQRMAVMGIGARAIFAVLLVAAAVLAFLSVATFDPHDRLGPGFRNAIGPVGHAIAETLRGFFGIGAFVLPIAGAYLAVLMVADERPRRRWPQVLCLLLLLVCGSVLAQLVFGEEHGWAHAPGGLLGRSVGGALTGLFSTVGTVVLVSALASVALIVGTQFYFLTAVNWCWEGMQWLGAKIYDASLAIIAKQKKRWADRAALAAEEEQREAAFLAALDAQDAELAELEGEAAEAEAIAEENARLQRETDEDRLARLARKEAERQIREAERQQREIERMAKQLVKEQRAEAKARAQAMVPQVTAQPADPLEVDPDELLPEAPLSGDPAWAMTLASPARAGAPLAPIEILAQSIPSDPPPTRRSRVPNIIEPPAMPPPPPPEALASLPPVPAAQLEVAAEGAPVAPAESLAPRGALARMPLIVEPKAPPKPTVKKQQEQFEFVGDRRSFQQPPIDILEVHKKERNALDKEAFLSTAEKLRAKLADFGIVGEVVEIRPGPVVTMYEFLPGPGIKVSKIAALADDLAMAMEAMRVRIVAPIPGKGVVGIEVPNKDRETVFLKEVAEQDAFQKSASRLTMCLGKDIEGMPYVLDLAKAPHLLIAGTTGSGKSVSVNAMIMSILLKSTPEEVRFIMVDPKMLELSVYEGIPHLLLPVVTDPRKAAIALQWAVDEMTRRYKLLAEAGVRNIAGYNALVDTTKKKPVEPPKPVVIDVKPVAVAQAPSPAPTPAPAAAATPEPAASPPKKKRKMLIVDLADGEATPAPAPEAAPPAAAADVGVPAPAEAAPENPVEPVDAAPIAPAVIEAEVKAAEKEGEIRVEETAEESAALALASVTAEVPAEDAANEKKKLPYIVVIIDELADLMMVASKEVETSVARLAQMARAAGIHLMVATQRPSTDVVTGVIKANFPTRISFMLRSKPDSMTVLGTVGAEALLGMGDMLILPPTSAHLQRVHGCFVSEVEIKRAVDHLKAQGKPVYDESILKPRDEDGGEEGEEDDLSDELYDQAVAIVSEMKQVSISMLQRKMRIGYNRSARMIERMERDGIVGPADGAKPRDVLIRPVGQMPAP